MSKRFDFLSNSASLSRPFPEGCTIVTKTIFKIVREKEKTCLLSELKSSVLNFAGAGQFWSFCSLPNSVWPQLPQIKLQ